MQRAASLLWFPIFFAIALPLTFQFANNHSTAHHIPVAVVGSTHEMRVLADELHRVQAGGFEVQRSPSVAAATAQVRDRKVAAAYVAGTTAVVYVARAASAIRANYVQGVFTRLATSDGQAPRLVDLVPLASRDGGTGIFFFVFPLMMAGLITAIVLVQLPAWGIGRRMTVVAVVGAVGALASYCAAVGFHVLPAKPLLLAYAFLLTQVYGQLMVGAAPLLKQYFLSVSLTLALILSVPSSSGTLSPDLMPAFFRDLSDALPLAQAAKVTRDIAYFHDNGITQATLILALWAAVAVGAVAFARLRLLRTRTADTPRALSPPNRRIASQRPSTVS